MVLIPKIKLLDLCLDGLVEAYGGYFVRSGGRYIMAKQPSLETLARYIVDFCGKEAERRVAKFDPEAPEYLFLLGGCEPRDNMLLEFRSGYFPKKLDDLVGSEKCRKYFMKERDIEIDGLFFNKAADLAFEKLFRPGGAGFASRPGNVFALRHRRLDCYALFKIMKYLYGAKNCVNSWTELPGKERLTAINDLICRYINNKTGMNRSPEFKTAVAEVKQYADGLMSNARIS